MVNIEKMAETAMYIVTYAGTAKSCYMNGLSEAKKGNFEKARELLKEGDKQYGTGTPVPYWGSGRRSDISYSPDFSSDVPRRGSDHGSRNFKNRYY